MPEIVSIIVPLFNRQSLVEETIRSVKQQTYGHWELLMVDDGSTDQSLEVAKRSAADDNRIQIWRRQSSVKGAPACRNEGLNRASGQWAIFLDSDDLLSRECLEARLKFAQENPGRDFYVFPTELFKKTPGDLSQVWFRPADDQLAAFLLKPSWQTTSSFWPIQSIRKLKGFREDLLSWQDWELHVRAIAKQMTFGMCHGEADNFCRRGLATRISIRAERDKRHLENRQLLFRDIHQLLVDENAYNDLRRKNFRIQCSRLGVKMIRSGFSEMVGPWLNAMVDAGIIEADKLAIIDKQIKEESRLTLRQRIQEWKLKMVSWMSRG